MNTRKQKVLLVITKATWGGAQRYVYDLALAARDAGHAVLVACGSEGTELAERLEAQGVRTVRVPELANTTSPLVLGRTAVALTRLFAAERPALVHLNSSVAGCAGALAARIAGVPRILFTAHGWAFNEDRSLLQRIVIKALHWLTVLLTHRSIAVSEAMVRQMNWPFASGKMQVIHNGHAPAPLQSRADARAALAARVPALRAHLDDPWTGTIAELHPIKRHEAVIDAVGELCTTHPQLRHIIMGGGVQRPVLEARVRDAGLTDHVFFAGHVPNAPAYLPALDIFTLTSRSEALAYAILEAGAAGLPVIATRVGGIPEVIVNDENGLLVTPGNHTTLVAALDRLLRSPEERQRLGTALRRTVSGHFSLEDMLAATLRVYEAT